MTKSKDNGFLYKFGYPPYKILIDESNNFIITCGGGGASKTGVPNEIELHEYPNFKGDDSNEQNKIMRINNVIKHNTGTVAIMSMDRHFNYIVCAEDHKLKEYILVNRDEIEEIDEVEKETQVRDRRKSESEQNDINGKEGHQKQQYELHVHREIDNLFGPIDGNPVDITHVKYGGVDNEFIVVGATNGLVKILQRYPDKRFDDDNDVNWLELIQMKTLRTLSSIGLPASKDVNEGNKKKVVSKGVSELAVSPCNDHLVTVNESWPDSAYARVWSIMSGVKITELALASHPRQRIKDTSRYKVKQVRYVQLISTRQLLLVTSHQPAVMDKKRLCYISIWQGLDYQLMTTFNLGRNKGGRSCAICTALSIKSDNLSSSTACLLAVGTGEGQVDIYRLQQLTNEISRVYTLPSSHSFFVTDIAFMPSPRNRGKLDVNRADVLSIGVDNMLRHHSAVYATYPWLQFRTAYLLACGLVFIIFIDRLLLLILFV